MSVSIRSFAVSRLAGAVTALWLCGAGAAWAGGGGGEDLGTLNNFLQNTLCPGLSISPCPQLPTVTQAVLQIAAWNLVPTEMIRATNSIANGSRVDAGNPSIPPVGPTPPPITAFPVTGTALSNLLPNLTPLAFISSSTSPAAVTQLYDPRADVFLYAVASGSGTQPDTLYLFYDDTLRTNGNLPQGQIVAKFSLPLTVLNGAVPNSSSSPVPKQGAERLVPTTLQFRATNAGDCSASTVVGNFSNASNGATQTLMASQIGVHCAVVFAPSPISTKSQAIFELQVPLVITGACSVTPPPSSCTPSSPETDPLYFFNPISNIGASFFTADETGFTPAPGILDTLGSIGMGPAAVPACSMTGTCPPPSPPPSMFALCANLPGGNGNGQAPIPAVAAYYAISTTGETLLEAARPGFSSSACPF